jgi:hypothetical protein
MENRTEALLTELRAALQQPDGALQDSLEEYAPRPPRLSRSADADGQHRRAGTRALANG